METATETKVRTLKKSLGIKSILAKTYESFSGLSQVWIDAIGEISDPFRWLIFGKPKNGKTSFILQFCKEISKFVKVYYNSMEEGDSKTMQQAFINAQMHEVQDGRFMLGDRDSFADMIEKLKKNHARVVVIDSRDYMKLTTDQYKTLTRTFPRKSFIIICWEQSGKPLGKYAKDIEFMVDMVTHVRNFEALTRGRFGIGKYKIWDRKTQAGEQATLNLTE